MNYYIGINIILNYRMPKHSFTVKTSLLIVESPAKCGKIQSYLGPGYKVIASFGHLRELNSLDHINQETFDIQYQVSSDPRKRKHIESMRNDINAAEEVIIATDDDREGEAIGWHICMLFDLPVVSTKRIVFREITQGAILDAMKSPRRVDMNLVNAQRARQALDLLVGFTITPHLWKHITDHADKSLSAGRCQTPALRLIYDNQKVYDSSPGRKVYNTLGYFTNNNLVFDLNKQIEGEEKMMNFLEETVNYDHIFTCSDVKIVTKKQPEPLTTSRIQQVASNLMRISPKETMKLCQTLYEAGYITYMRTDSKKYSGEFLDKAVDYILKTYLDEKYVRHDIKTLENSNEKEEKKEKKKGKKPKKEEKEKSDDHAQEAHEAIRPTNVCVIDLDDDKITAREKALYKIIRETTLESCMEVAEYLSITASISAPCDLKYTYTSEVVHFPGWKIVKKDYEKDVSSKQFAYLQTIKQSMVVHYKNVSSKTTLTDTKMHYTEAKLVQMLEDNGIGRPSTFSMLVDKIQERGYVKKTNIAGNEIECIDFELIDDTITESKNKKEMGNEKGKLVIQPIGVVVMEFLDKYFEHLFAYKYTSDMEKELDLVSKGQMAWKDICKSCIECMKEMSNQLGELNDKKMEYSIDEHHTFMIAKYGPVIRCKPKGKSKKATFLPVIEDIDMERLKTGGYTLDEIVKPKGEKTGDTKEGSGFLNTKIGKYKGDDLYIRNGKYGFYASWGKSNISLASLELQESDIASITIGMVTSIIEENTRSKANGGTGNTNIIRNITDNISIRNGKYGDYIFYKTPTMTKPKFHKLDGYNNDYRTGSIDLLKNWINETYSLEI